LPKLQLGDDSQNESSPIFLYAKIKNSMMIKRLVLLAIFAGMGVGLAWASEVQVISSVDKKKVHIDEEIALTIRILGSRANLQAPRLPVFQGFDSFYTGRTSHFTFADGKSSGSVEFSYVLVPKVAGVFTLESVQVWVDGKVYKTDPVQIEVIGPQGVTGGPRMPPQPVGTPPVNPTTQAPTAPAAPAASYLSQPQATPPQVIQDENIFVKAWADKLSVFPNEQILLTYTLYTRYDTRYEGFEEEPSVSGFWIEDFPLDRDLGRETVSEGGKRYVKADIRKTALFPTSPGQYTINPGVLKVSVRDEPKSTSLFDDFFNDSFFSGASFFARRVERLLKPQGISVTVRPFPEAGKPKSFNGAVGRFQISASVDKNEVKQNEPVTLKLILEGEGNVGTLPKPPVPELTGFKVYDGDSSSQLFKAGASIAGKKTFEMIFIPTEAGSLSIPPLEFSFFDPRRQEYQVLRTQAFPLKVTPSAETVRLPAGLAQKQAFQKEVSLEGRDIRYIHEELPSGRFSFLGAFLFQILLGANLAGLALTGIGIFRRRQEDIFSRDVGLKRRKLARQTALRRLKGLRALMDSQSPEEARKFMEEAEKVLTEYLANKFNVSMYSFTREWLEEKLTEVLGADDPMREAIRRFYDFATEARFGRGAHPTQERHHFFNLIEKVIQRIEK